MKTNPTRIRLKHRTKKELDGIVKVQRSSISKIKTGRNQSKKRITHVWDESLQPYTVRFAEPHNTQSYVKSVVWAKSQTEAFTLATDLYPNDLNRMLVRKGIADHYENIPLNKRIFKSSKKQKALADKLCNESITKSWKRLHPKDSSPTNIWSKKQTPKVNKWKLVLKSASSDIRRLSYVNRYSSIPTLMKENTGEHSFYVALYAMLIHRELVKTQDVFFGVTNASIMLHALTHDFSDMISGDLVRPFKYSSSDFTKAVHQAEEQMLSKVDERLLELYDFARSHINWYVESVVKAADFMSLYQYMWREKNMGNKEIEPFFQRMISDMKMMQQKLLNEKVDPEFNKYRLELAVLYEAMSNELFEQNFVTS